MKKTMKQWMAITCALAMIVSLLPVTILAEEGAATPTDLASVTEFVQESEPEEELAENTVEESVEELAENSLEESVEEPAAEPEEEKVTVVASIAVAKRDGKIFLTAVAEPELVGNVIWEKRAPGQAGENWTRIGTDISILIVPGSELIGMEIRFRLEDGTTSVRSYIVPVLEAEEVPEEGTIEPVVENIEEEPDTENEIVPANELPAEEPADGTAEEAEPETEPSIQEAATEEPIEEPADETAEETEAETELSIPEAAAEEPVTEVQEIEDYETPLGLEFTEIESGIPEETAEEPGAEEISGELSEEDMDSVSEEPKPAPAKKHESAPEETESAGEDELQTIVLERIGDDEFEDVDVREEPDGMSAIFTSLPEGAEVVVLSVDGDWAAVEVDGQQGYIFLADLQAWMDTAEDEEEPAEPEMKVTIFSSRRTVMHYGETVTLTSRLEGFDGYELSFQWECDKHDGSGYQLVEGATADNYSFSATAESLSWDWCLTVNYN